MRKCRKLAALVVATLWVAVGCHCLLELIPGLGFLGCDVAHAEAGSHCGDHACQTLETGQFLLVTSSNLQGAPPLPWAGILVEPAAPISTQAFSLRPHAQAPPDLSSRWQFAQRAVLPVRAPALLG